MSIRIDETFGYSGDSRAAALPTSIKRERRNTVVPSSYLASTRFLNRIVAAVLLVPATPVILVVGLAIKLTSRGPMIYRQRRVGLHGHHFHVLKLRTMRQDAEKETGPVWATRTDSRVTPLGRVLRKLHIDEFPQLWNVLKGDMAIIGPRPERPEIISKLVPVVPKYLDRLTVLPGITGLAQILLPPDSDVDGVRRKIEQDLRYICGANPVLDVRILLCTGLRLCGLPGHWAVFLAGFSLNDREQSDEFNEQAGLRRTAANGSSLSRKPKPR